MDCRRAARECFLLSCVCCGSSAEALCALGESFMKEENWQEAVLWYRAALLCRPKRCFGAFSSPDACGYVPLMQLCVCLDRMGEHHEAARMNEQALLLYPDDPAALANRAYFAGILKKTEDGCKMTSGEA